MYSLDGGKPMLEPHEIQECLMGLPPPPLDWNEIHGACVVHRTPPWSDQASGQGPTGNPAVDDGPHDEHGQPIHPHISIDDMVATLRFYKDRDARKVALMRDSQRESTGRVHVQL